MRQQFDITIVRVEGEGEKAQTTEKIYKVTTSFAARTIIDQRMGGPLAFYMKMNQSGGIFTITDATCFLWALISAAGYKDVTEVEVGEFLNDLGEVKTQEIMLPILTHWVEAVDQRKKKTPAKPSGSARAKRIGSS
jgi:RecJ-like exonuclease